MTSLLLTKIRLKTFNCNLNGYQYLNLSTSLSLILTFSQMFSQMFQMLVQYVITDLTHCSYKIIQIDQINSCVKWIQKKVALSALLCSLHCLNFQ